MFCVVFCATRTPNFWHVLLMLHACMYVCNATKLLNLFLCCLSLNVGIVFLLSKLKVLPGHVHRSSPMSWGALLWTRQKSLIGYSLSLEGHYWSVCNTYRTTPEFWIWNLYIGFLLAVSVVEVYFLKYCFASTSSFADALDFHFSCSRLVSFLSVFFRFDYWIA